MWTCTKCGRSFEHRNQSHYCGKAPQTIEEYIQAQMESVRPFLNRMRETVGAALPEAEERISWGMPTYWKRRNIIHFAANKNHIGLYPGEEAVAFFADRLKEYKTSKGAIQFPYSEPLPLELIETIAKWCYAENR